MHAQQALLNAIQWAEENNFRCNMAFGLCIYPSGSPEGKIITVREADILGAYYAKAHALTTAEQWRTLYHTHKERLNGHITCYCEHALNTSLYNIVHVGVWDENPDGSRIPDGPFYAAYVQLQDAYKEATSSRSRDDAKAQQAQRDLWNLCRTVVRHHIHA